MPIRTRSIAAPNPNPTPTTPPPTQVPEIPNAPASWDRFVMTWTGWDGSLWPLTDPTYGVFLTSEGVRGLAMPPTKRYTSASPAVAGTQYRGHSVDERGVFWPLYLYSDAGSQAWLERDRAFWKTMRPDQVGEWRVINPVTGEVRVLRCRFNDDGDQAFPRDPFFFGWAVYGITLAAESPFWESDEPISRVWTPPGSSTGIFAGPGVVNIAAASTTALATVDNPGDVDAWMRWTIEGAIGAGSTVGVAGSVITLPAVADGKKLTIDTDPTQLTAIERDVSDVDNLTDGTDRTGDLGDPTSFAPIPAGSGVTLELDLTTPGTNAKVRGELTPRYYRAW